MAASGTPRELLQSTDPGPTTDLGPGHLHCKVARLLNLCPRAGEVNLQLKQGCMSGSKRTAAHRRLPPVRAGLCVPSCPTPCWRASASSTHQESCPGRSRGSAEVSKAPGMVGSGSMLCLFSLVCSLASGAGGRPPGPCCPLTSQRHFKCCVG